MLLTVAAKMCHTRYLWLLFDAAITGVVLHNSIFLSFENMQSIFFIYEKIYDFYAKKYFTIFNT